MYIPSNVLDLPPRVPIIQLIPITSSFINLKASHRLGKLKFKRKNTREMRRKVKGWSAWLGSFLQTHPEICPKEIGRATLSRPLSSSHSISILVIPSCSIRVARSRWGSRRVIAMTMTISASCRWSTDGDDWQTVTRVTARGRRRIRVTKPTSYFPWHTAAALYMMLDVA